MGKKTKVEDIVCFGESFLREICTPVEVFHKGLHKKIDLMCNTLKESEGGAALAAPQISILKRIVVIDYLGEYFELINPEIVERSGARIDYEGCLSFPGFYGRVKRFSSVKVNYQDRFGRPCSVEVKDEMAKCFQHEIDHLDGILYIDRMADEYVYNELTNEKVSVKHLQRFP